MLYMATLLSTGLLSASRSGGLHFPLDCSVVRSIEFVQVEWKEDKCLKLVEPNNGYNAHNFYQISWTHCYFIKTYRNKQNHISEVVTQLKNIFFFNLKSSLFVIDMLQLVLPNLINRPGVAGAFLQTPLLLIISLSRWSHSSKPSKLHYTQTQVLGE